MPGRSSTIRIRVRFRLYTERPRPQDVDALVAMLQARGRAVVANPWHPGDSYYFTFSSRYVPWNIEAIRASVTPELAPAGQVPLA